MFQIPRQLLRTLRMTRIHTPAIQPYPPTLLKRRSWPPSLRKLHKPHKPQQTIGNSDTQQIRIQGAKRGTNGRAQWQATSNLKIATLLVR